MLGQKDAAKSSKLTDPVKISRVPGYSRYSAVITYAGLNYRERVSKC